MKPVQKKLEKQVNSLHWQLQEKETKLRKAAAEKANQDPTIIEKFVPVPAVAAKRAERVRIVKQKAEQGEQRRKAPEAKQAASPRKPQGA